MIRTCNQFKLCGGVIQHKTKPNQAPSVWHREVSILKACFPSTVAFYQEVCGIFFFFKPSIIKFRAHVILFLVPLLYLSLTMETIYMFAYFFNLAGKHAEVVHINSFDLSFLA